MDTRLPKIQTDIPGPDGQPGFLLIVPRDEVLDWDIRNEIGSASRYWIAERQAWWVAAAYLYTAQEIVRRFAPPAALEAPPIPVAPSPRSAAAWAGPRSWLRARWRWLGALFSRRWRVAGRADTA